MTEDTGVSFQDVVVAYVEVYKDMGYTLSDIEDMLRRIFELVLADVLEAQINE